MLDRFLRAPFRLLASFVFKYKYVVFVVSLAISVVAFSFAKKIKLDPSLRSLLPGDHPVLQVIDEAAEVFGHLGTLIMVVKVDDFDAGVKYVDTMVPKLEEHPEVNWVAYRAPEDFFEKNLLLYADKADIRKIYNRLDRKFKYEKTAAKLRGSLLFDEEDLPRDPGFQYQDIVDKYKKRHNIRETKFKTSYFHRDREIDGKQEHTFVIIIKPKQSSLNMTYSKNLVDAMEKLVKHTEPQTFHPSMDVAFTGRYKKKPESIKALGADFQKVTAISGIGILLVLLIYFQSFWPIVLVFTGLINGIVITLGLTQFTLGSLNLVTTFLVAILLGLGIDFGIHFILRYKEEFDRTQDAEQAFDKMFNETGIASFTAAMTTAVAFFGLTLSGFAAFSDFGLIAGMGVLSILFSYMTFMASFLLIVVTVFKGKFGSPKIHLRWPSGVRSHPRKLLIGGGIFAAVCVGTIALVQFDYDFSKVLGNKNLPSYELDKEVSERFDRSFVVPSVVVPRDIKEERKLLALLEKNIEENKGKKENRLDKVVGISTFLPKQQEAKLKEIRRLRGLVNKNRKYLPLVDPKIRKYTVRFEEKLKVERLDIEQLPLVLRKNFQGQQGHEDRHMVMVYSRANLNDGKQILEFSEQLSSIRIDGKPIKIASDSLIFAEVLRLIQGDGWWILVFTFSTVFLLAALNFSSFKKAALVLVPVFVGLLWLAGSQGIVGLRIDFINVIIYPIIIGIGIDSGVHIYHRYTETGDIIKSVRNTGEAVSLASLTTLLGFGALWLSKNETISGMGLMAVLGILTTYMASMLVLPSIVRLTDKKDQGPSAS